MAEHPPSMTACVASNGINTLVVPTAALVPTPEVVGGEDHLPRENPSVTIELPEEPQSRVSIGLGGTRLGPDRYALHKRVLFIAVPPLTAAVAHGRISYVVDGALKLHRFQLRRAEDIDELMDSVQAQFDNMTELVECFTEDVSDDEQVALAFEHTFGLQAGLVNAMEPMGWSPEDYDKFRARASELQYIEGPEKS